MMPSPTQDTRDRVIRLEEEVKHLKRKIDDMDRKVTEMHYLLLHAKGAKWMLMILIAIGGFVAAKITPIIAYLFPTK